MKPKLIDLRFEYWERQYRLPVLIFPNKDAMLGHFNTIENDILDSETEACFRGLAYSLDADTGEILDDKIGYICLYDGGFGIGIFSHELQHFVSEWSVGADWDLAGLHWEDVSKLVGDLQNQFWTQWYAWRENLEDIGDANIAIEDFYKGENLDNVDEIFNDLGLI